MRAMRNLRARRAAGKTSRERESGLALAETALVMIFLVLVTFAIIEYGWLFLKAHQVTSAAREGVRVGARADATDDEARAAAASVLDDSGLSGEYTLDVQHDFELLSGGDTQETLTMTVTIGNYGNVAILGLAIIPLPGSLTYSLSMVKETP